MMIRVVPCLLPRLLVALLAALGAGPLSGCSVNPATGRSQLLLLSSNQVAEMGQVAKPDLIASYGGEISDSKVRTYVASVGNSLAQFTEADNPALPWSFIVLNSDVINAFALPGGNVFITRGLLTRIDSEASLAGVLGHEIGHVTARHVDERMSQATGIQLGVAVLAGTTQSQLIQVAGDLFGNGYLLHFGRSQELEADSLGLRYMVRAGYDPRGQADVMEMLEAASQGNRTPEMLSTHPDPGRRLQAINTAIQRDYAKVINNPNYGLYEDRYRQNVLSRLGASSASLSRPSPPLFCAVCAHAASPESRAGPAQIAFRTYHGRD